MAEGTLPDRTGTVVVGAGIVGTSTAYHLAGRGRTDVTVVDMGPIPETGGSTVHAPGGLVQTTPSKVMSELAQYSRNLYSDLDGFKSEGFLELATSEERWKQAQRYRDYSKSWGVPGGELVTPGEVADLNPLIDTGEIQGAYYSPTCGLIRPVELLEAMVDRAESAGIAFHGDTRVTDIETAGGAVEAVVTDRGRIRCDDVLVATNIWAPLFGEMVGVDVPLAPCEHQYVVTEPLDELRGTDEEVGLTGFRHQDAALYFRQHGEGYGVGSYNHTPRIVDPRDIPTREEAPEEKPVYDYFVGRDHDRDPIKMPANRPFREDDFSEAWADAQGILPALEGAAIDRSFNGMFCFTPDGMPIMGTPPEPEGFWVAAAVWLTHAGGVGRAMAEWMDDGYPKRNLVGTDINRFQSHAGSRQYVRDRGAYSYDTVYDLVHPRQLPETNRGLRTGPFYPHQQDLGARTYNAAGWERPRWFDANDDLVERYADRIPDRDGWEARYWSPIEGAEHLAVRDGLGMYDLSSFTNVDVTGPDALGFVQRTLTNDMDVDVGRATYTLVCNDHGGVLGDMTAIRKGEDHFHVLANAGAVGTEELAWLRRQVRPDEDVSVTPDVGGRCALGVWGPDARAALDPVVEADLSEFPYFTARETYVGEVPVTALRVSYVGELGWELHADAEYGHRLWDLVWEAGQEYDVRPMGDGALNTMRLEKGYPLIGADVTPEYDPYEAGLGFAVDLDTDFVGRDAVAETASEGPSVRRTTLTLDDPEAVVFNGVPVLDGDETVGYVASTEYGYSVGRAVAHAYLPADLDPGTGLTVEYEAERYDATVREAPVFDPERERLLS